jgi:hypothetical protein
MISAGLTVRQQQRLGMRFVLITLAQKWSPSEKVDYPKNLDCLYRR